VDNPDALLRQVALLEPTDSTTLGQAERILEAFLSEAGNNVRVRCNPTNRGASASRSRGLDESSAEYVLFLDDDIVPHHDLLEAYGHKLQDVGDEVAAFVGLVRFPRSPALPLRYAAVLMSYLTFMFEIAMRDMHPSPAWGVTETFCSGAHTSALMRGMQRRVVAKMSIIVCV
jgi:glycosyltransferase involved in cell wall biosynthesis